jgi:chromosome segregation and condensation protein ScpB
VLRSLESNDWSVFTSGLLAANLKAAQKENPSQPLTQAVWKKKKKNLATNKQLNKTDRKSKNMTKEKLEELKLLTEEKLAASELARAIYRWVALQNKDMEMENKAWEETQTAFKEWDEAWRIYTKAADGFWKEVLAQ